MKPLLPIGRLDPDSHTIDLPFPAHGGLDALLDRLQAAIAHEAELRALELMLELQGVLRREHAELYSGLLAREPGWNDEDERLCDRMYRRYQALAEAGARVVENLAEWYRAGEQRLQLARDITLGWFGEATRWKHMHSVTAARLVHHRHGNAAPIPGGASRAAASPTAMGIRRREKENCEARGNSGAITTSALIPS